MSHSLVLRYIVLLTVGVYSSNHGVLYYWNPYNEEISPVLPSVCNAIRSKMPTPLLLRVE